MCRISRRTICRTPSICSTHTPVKLYLTSASMSPPSCRRCRRSRRRYRRAPSSLSPRGTAPLSESTEDDLQDAYSGDAASNIGTNVSTVLSSLSPSGSSPCLPPTPAIASSSAQTISLTASLCPPSYSPASPPPPYLPVHPLTDIRQLIDTQLMRFAIGQLVWLLDVVRQNVHLFRSGDVADLDGRRVISIRGALACVHLDTVLHVPGGTSDAPL